MFKVSNIYICIYIYMYIYIICYTYELHLIQIRPFPSEGRIGRNSSTSYKLSPSHQENPPWRLPPPKLYPSQGFPTQGMRGCPPPLAENSPTEQQFLCYNLIKTSFYSHYFCTIFILASYSLYRQLMIILTLMFIIYRMFLTLFKAQMV